MAFNPTKQQLEVINHDIGRHGRVLAGPGTGKSSTAVALAERLAALDPKPSVKFLTFTRAATAELVKKVREAGQGATMPSTVHSFAISVLLRNDGAAPVPQPLRIADDWEQDNLIVAHLTAILKSNGGPLKVVKKSVKDLLAEMAAQWESLNPGEQDEKIPQALRDLFVGVFNLHRQTFGYTLLSELPYLLLGVLETVDDVDGVGHDLMLVDEYQDLNHCDLEVLRHLTLRGSRILAIGDDDQSIYSFRWAHPEGIRRFPQDYPGAAEYNLTICHRLNERIGAWAEFVIAGDESRAPREKPTYGDSQTGHVELLAFPSSEDEADGIVAIVKSLIEKHGLHPTEIALLFRTDSNRRFSAPIQEALEAAGIPVVDSQKAKRLLSEPGTRRLLAVLQLLVNPRDSLAWWALAHLREGVGERTIHEIFGLARANGMSFGEVVLAEAPGFGSLKPAAASKMGNLYEEIAQMMDAVSQAIPAQSAAWGSLIVDLVSNGQLPECSGELLTAIAETDGQDDDEEVPFKEFVTRFGLLLREQVEANLEGVRCMTMMSSKGLTVRAAIVVGVDSEFLPRTGHDVHEEQRLLYVAMTRAKDHLFLTYAQHREGPRAHAGRPNFGFRHATGMLTNGPVKPGKGGTFVAGL